MYTFGSEIAQIIEGYRNDLVALEVRTEMEARVRFTLSNIRRLSTQGRLPFVAFYAGEEGTFRKLLAVGLTKLMGRRYPFNWSADLDYLEARIHIYLQEQDFTQFSYSYWMF